MCTKNYDLMMYGSWNMVRDRCNYFSFWAFFCPFTPLKTQKIIILKKWKKHLEISSFYICVPKITNRWCTVPEIWWVMDVIIFHFGPFFALLLPNNQKNQCLKRNKKHTWRHHHFTNVYQKLWSHDVRFLRFAAQQRDGQTEKVTYRGGCPT